MSDLVLTRPALPHSDAAMLTEAQALQVADQASLDHAGSLAIAAAECIQAIELYHNGTKEKPGPKVNAYHSWKAWCRQEETLLTPWRKIRAMVEGKIAGFREEQERQRRAEEARLAEEQRKKQEEEQLQVALAAESLGVSDADVNAILEEQPVPQALALPPTYEMPRGVSGRTIWYAEVTDFGALVKAVADGTVPRNVLVVDQGALNAHARALKTLMKWPGVRVFTKSGIATRTR